MKYILLALILVNIALSQVAPVAVAPQPPQSAPIPRAPTTPSLLQIVTNTNPPISLPPNNANQSLSLSPLSHRSRNKVSPPYPYSLEVSSSYQKYPSLQTKVALAADQYVTIFYNIAISSFPAACIFVTRLVIDGAQQTSFRFITGQSIYHSHIVNKDVWLFAGEHTITVQYRTVQMISNIQKQDWNTAQLQVTYN